MKEVCDICSRNIEEEAHYCEISDCLHRNNYTMTEQSKETGIPEMLDEAYNLGLDHAIKVVSKYDTGKELSPLITTILKQLNELKK